MNRMIFFEVFGFEMDLLHINLILIILLFSNEYHFFSKLFVRRNFAIPYSKKKLKKLNESNKRMSIESLWV